MALRSGARLRRADCRMTSARRHMRLYRPSVVIVDIGLPDGSGLDLIREISSANTRVPAIIGTSGDDMMHNAALKAGADTFISKNRMRAFRRFNLKSKGSFLFKMGHGSHVSYAMIWSDLIQSFTVTTCATLNHYWRKTQLDP